MKTTKNLLLIAAFLISISANSQRDCSTLSGSCVPIENLGTSTYMTYQGGQYPGGSNTRPALQLTRALNQVNAIMPLNSSGAIDQTNGKIVMIGIGASNPRTEFTAFKQYCDTFQCLNSKLKIINTCKGGTGIQKMVDPNDTCWEQAIDTLLSHSVTNLQVQVAWIEQEHTGNNNTSFPGAPQQLVTNFKDLLEVVLQKYPNIKIAYINSRAYSGYADNSTGPGLWAPRDYYNSWAVKWVIENQITNATGFDYTGSNPSIPFVDWATNSWANGNIPKLDGFFWDCVNDFGPGDGLHLSTLGEKKVGQRLFNYFSKDTTAKVWFVDASCKPTITKVDPIDNRTNKVQIFPNPASDKLNITCAGSFSYEIYNSLGELITGGQHKEVTSVINVSEFEKGIYLLKTKGDLNLNKLIIVN
ncbi:MAG: T9SS type A sorting domain-containing protein [Sphingobacteriaceae bacterium]|nr:T9SS type A sorting domain-containing protein [Sphingobacteriaceae bacterium]